MRRAGRTITPLDYTRSSERLSASCESRQRAQANSKFRWLHARATCPFLRGQTPQRLRTSWAAGRGTLRVAPRHATRCKCLVRWHLNHMNFAF
jgi:hypothetical protein